MTLRNSRSPRRIPIGFDDDDSASRPDENAASLSSDVGARDPIMIGSEENEHEESSVLVELIEPDVETDDFVSIDADEYADGLEGFEEDARGKAESANDLAGSVIVAGPAVAELVATRSELRRIEGELQKSEAERDATLGSQARLQADFDNYRKRSERDRAEARQVLIGEVVEKLLPVVDNFRRAVEAQNAIGGDELSQFVVGVELIRKQLDDVLCSYGVEPIMAVGEIFDPHCHEAIATEARTDIPPGTILEEVVRGYRIGEKLLRPAAVKVAVAP